MKFSISKSITTLLAAGAVMFGITHSPAQVTVKVDSTLPWQGYVNAWETNGTTYATGFVYPPEAVRGEFIPAESSGWPLNTLLILRPNVGTYNPDDPFWNAPDGTPNKVLEANFYRDVGTGFAGQEVTFEGTVTTNNIPEPTDGPASGWQVVAFIKEFTTSYGFIGITTAPLVEGQPFSVSRPIGANSVCQYGFYLFGPNTAPDSAAALTAVGVVVEDADPAIMTQPVGQTLTTGNSVNLSVTAIGGSALSYQWSRHGTNLVDGGNISGANSPTLTIANAQVSDSGPYFVTVTDTAGSVDSMTVQVNVLDIVITTPPQSQRVEQGSTVQLSVEATSSGTLNYQWKRVVGETTNNLADGPGISGATTATLTLSDVQPNQTGTYVVTLSTGSGSANASAFLNVKSYADFANFLENPGFDNDPTGADESPWQRFESTDSSFGVFQDVNDTYFGGGNVNVHAGTHVSYTTFNAEWSGIYQDVAASPGQIFAADMWFYNASGDPIPGAEVSANSESFLEVQFRNGGTVLQQYITPFITPAAERDVWFNLQATNAGGFGTMPPTSNAKYLVAPPGTTTVRFQVTMHDLGGSVGLGSLYYDSARLMLKIPVELTFEVAGGNVSLSWKTQGATSYQVQYTEDLGSGTWEDVEVVAGTGQVVTKTYPTAGTQRLYRVLTL